MTACTPALARPAEAEGPESPEVLFREARQRRRRRWALGPVLAVVLVGAAAVGYGAWGNGSSGHEPSGSSGSATGRSSAPTHASSSKQTPRQAALAWFAAINHKDKSAAVADFEPSAAQQMGWGGGDQSTWPSFSSVRCKTLRQSATNAIVYCTFSETQAPAAGQLDHFWEVWFHRSTRGRWLIDNYGQG